MFHPIGSQPPVVYWRRRLLLIASAVALLVLIALTVNAVTSGNSGALAAGSSTRPTTPAPSPSPSSPAAGSARPPTRSTGAASTSAGPRRSPSSGSSSSGSPSSSESSGSTTAVAAPRACTAKDVTVVAVPQQASYRVGDAPVMQMQVTDVSGVACAQDLADRQVELKVYNGESRVWGSHDCMVEPGTALRTLTPNVPVLVAVSWSGLSSEPGCTATRQRVGAGTYTLYAALSGRVGRAGRFTIS